MAGAGSGSEAGRPHFGPRMKTSKSTLCASLLAVACMFAVPVSHGADAKSNEAKAAKKAEQEKKQLEKYDANKNGKLDVDENAAIKADAEKAKADRKEKKEAKDNK